MPNDPTPTGNGPWRLLILDRDPQDSKWILATVATPADVEPAQLSDAAAILPAGGAWVRRQLGRPHATLVPMTRVSVWRIDEQQGAGQSA
jgi:hypothetical protein